MTELWPHQLAAVEKLAPLGRGALFMEMGDGKTRTALELVARWGCRRVLILCPLKVVRVWPAEFAKHLGGNWQVGALDTGTIKQRCGRILTEGLCAACDDAPWAAAINYDALPYKPLPAALCGSQWDCIIADEVHRMKDPSGVGSLLVAQIAASIPHRLLLTGTPMPHSQLDIFAQWRILAPEVFGTDWFRFQRHFAAMEQKTIWYKPKARPGKPPPKAAQKKVWVIAKDPETGQPVYTHTAELQAKIAPMAFRSNATEKTLPPTTDQSVYCLLDPATQRVYHDMEQDFVATCGPVEEIMRGIVAGTVTAPNALVKGLRLAQIANGFATDTETGDIIPLGTEKADLLADVMADLPPDESIVVFGRFVEDLAAIAQTAEAQGRGYHEVSGRRNELAVWQSGAGNVLGVQLQAGGVGVDFTRARYQVYYSLDYVLGNYLQTRKRIHRPGQTRPVTYIHLLAAGTVDEVILKALQDREATVVPIVEGLAEQDA